MGSAFFSYLCLALGYRTRFFTFLSRVFVVSFSARASVISHGGDDLTFQIFYVVERTPAANEPYIEPKNELLWDYYCFEKPKSTN